MSKRAKNEAQQRRRAPLMPETIGAQFDIGDRVLFHAPGTAQHGAALEISERYGLFLVEGVLRYGYIVRSGRLESFASPGQLREFVEKPFHVRRIK